jgi:hypothetical protein
MNDIRRPTSITVVASLLALESVVTIFYAGSQLWDGRNIIYLLFLSGSITLISSVGMLKRINLGRQVYLLFGPTVLAIAPFMGAGIDGVMIDVVIFLAAVFFLNQEKAHQYFGRDIFHVIRYRDGKGLKRFLIYASPTLVAVVLWFLTWGSPSTTEEGIGWFYVWFFILGPTWIISQIVWPVIFFQIVSRQTPRTNQATPRPKPDADEKDESREDPSALKSLGYAFLIGLAVLIIMIAIYPA